MRPPTPPADAPAAGLWPRTVAWLVDALLLAALAAMASAALPGARWPALVAAWRALGATMGRTMLTMFEHGGDPPNIPLAMLAANGPLRPAIAEVAAALHHALAPPLLLLLGLALLYWPFGESGSAQATPGKRLVGLRVTDAHGRRLGPVQALKRHLAGGLSWLSLNIGHLLAAQGPEHLALHDRLADTRVRWRDGAARKTPAWGWLLVVAAMLLPPLLAAQAMLALARAMNAAMGL
ncbi:RDD family protein [Lysobacter pythonis]|uniref:RDD family protein n=1 Tax=Solilutibacter pythonis TaxID=2483112 RepID=A0A3M2HKJ6_9GAMM|nr:RDD family protein [Lysobacter pythonis]RMH88110.1 RDD family protein [Lysobacter pythonis]